VNGAMRGRAGPGPTAPSATRPPTTQAKAARTISTTRPTR
jgi:hypothetical protein